VVFRQSDAWTQAMSDLGRAFRELDETRAEIERHVGIKSVCRKHGPDPYDGPECPLCAEDDKILAAMGLSRSMYRTSFTVPKVKR
jgi:hypothetical protein